MFGVLRLDESEEGDPDLPVLLLILRGGFQVRLQLWLCEQRIEGNVK